jgi:myo-inositol 2-dehydrogenase/D-chiro-inositol 1-dehydrogenase
VVDVVPAAAKAMATKYGASFHTTLDDALTQLGDEIDLVVVTTPTFCHGAAIKTASNAGKAVFTEKPVAEDEEEISELFAHCEARGTALMCGFQRRFDRAYVELAEAVQAGRLGKIAFVRIFFGDHPSPPIEFLLKGGCPFMDLAPHDVDFVRWMLGGEDPDSIYASGSSSTAELGSAGVLDNALVTMTFPGGALCTLSMTRGAVYGYDNRIEVFGEKGMMVVETPRESTVQVADASGFHSARLQHSFPERFSAAFAAEMDLAVRVALGEEGATWPVCADDCAAAQTIASAAARAQRLGEIVRIRAGAKPPPHGRRAAAGPLRVRPVGAGRFGRYIQSLPSAPGRAVLSRALQFVEPFTRSSGLDWTKDVLDFSQPDGRGNGAAYVCTPDALHRPQALELLAAGLDVLVEKPVTPDFAGVGLARARAGGGRVLMVGFHRRFDDEFCRLKRRVDALRASGDVPRRVTIESFDPVPADPNLAFVLRNSCCHDVDVVCWLFPDANIEWLAETKRLDPKTSTIEIDARATHGDGRTTEVLLRYRKEWPSYVQRVTVDSLCFGYDHAGPYPQSSGCCGVYETAYVAQLQEFASQVAARDEAAQKAQCAGYERSFACLEDAAQALGL